MKNKILNMALFFMKIKKNRITILDETEFSGSNSTAMRKVFEKKSEFEVRVFNNKEGYKIFEKIKKHIFIGTSNIILTTHSVIRYKKQQKVIQLWHGIPLKSMGLLDINYCSKWNDKDKKIFDSCDYFISTSKFYNTILNATLGQIADKYKILGYPRNDFMMTVSAVKLEGLFEGFDITNKNIFYIPTFKNGYKNRNEGNSKEQNFFGIDSFSIMEFSAFLSKNKLNFILKMHPFEEQLYKKIYMNMKIPNVYFMSSEILKENDSDLYEFLSESDILITDYSSIYLDYLITNKPILFINPDEEEYREKRGFLLEPYDVWTPGPKVTIQSDIEKEIVHLLNNKEYFAEERAKMKSIFHENSDNCSSERVYDFIKKIAEERWI
ncbi:CDP-glycerol glycerophosphotransferase family protein [uncultured Clostridium sp.]|uniref:CDP-glycerol glycerophosphotransferase family protein n=1 Tax=uncultured Clostridium sp. TaxID=59620 RepID=UPI00262C8272|nr:CDP-glycerol glycerophosphotransferase family protein [uncultured Clostridium sp.]